MAVQLTTVTPYGRAGGSSRVRVFDWVDHLTLDSRTVDYLGLASNRPRALTRRLPRVISTEFQLRALTRTLGNQTLVLSKQASPFSTGRLEERLLASAGVGVYDFDDSLLDETPGGVVQRAFRKDRIWRRAVRAADVVIAGNDYLADQASSLVPTARVHVIPSCIEPAAYPRKNDYAIRSTPWAVWLGSPSTEAHLLTAAPALLAVHRTHGLRLGLISAGHGPLGDLEPMVDRIEWSPDATRHLAQFDFGIMPLPDTPQARGKCAYKLLQYAAAALPCIASPVGANRQALDLGLGFPADGRQAWVDTITRLVDASDDERHRVGRQAADAVTSHYSFAAWAPRWREVTGT